MACQAVKPVTTQKGPASHGEAFLRISLFLFVIDDKNALQQKWSAMTARPSSFTFA